MAKIIVTDLTKFKTSETLCTAGIDIDTGECARPMPYLKVTRCKKLNLLPGAILTGEFSKTTNIQAPHHEDRDYQKLTYHGQCGAKEFRDVLARSAVSSLTQGFGVLLPLGEKCITPEMNPKCSLITLSVMPSSVRIEKDRYNPNKIKLHFTDGSGAQFRYISITDLGFAEYAEKKSDYEYINQLLHNQEEVFLRVGLSRRYKSPNGKDGFWLQVNGIYSFPDYFKPARCYEGN